MTVPGPFVLELPRSRTGGWLGGVASQEPIAYRLAGTVRKALHHTALSPRGLPLLWGKIRPGEEDQKALSQGDQKFVDQVQHGQRGKQLQQAALALQKGVHTV